MNEAAQWQRNNEAYLAAAFRWLRLSLKSMVPEPGPILVEEQAMAAEIGNAGSWRIFRKLKTEPEFHKEVVHDIDNNTHPRLSEIAKAAAELKVASESVPPPALVILGQRLGLSEFEQQVLLFCAALELDTAIAPLCARAHDDANKPYPTFSLALALFDEPAWDALSPHRPLRRLHLLEINQPAAQPLTASALRADERILNFIKGLNEFDERFAPLISPIDPPFINLPPSQREIADEILGEIRRFAESSPGVRLPMIELTGIDGTSKQFIAAQVADELEMQLWRLPAEVLPENAAEQETLARLWQRETLLRPVALYLDASELTAESHANEALRHFRTQCTGLTFIDTRASRSNSAEDVIAAEISNPTTVEQEQSWTAELSAILVDTADGGEVPQEITSLPSLLANQFNLSPPVIHRIAEKALFRPLEDQSLRDVIWELCLASSRPRLDTLAQRIDARATHKDIVLPDEETTLLHRIVEQVRNRGTVYDEWGFRARMNRGLGISALFAGDSGTGKTMAAEVIANELDLNLYRIDLSAVVSKFIGETEKNLRKLFDAAEDGGAILFFDEADALFGKRSEVKDSHDRYANIEINYLLQRLESFKGLSILATNMKSSMDAAFVRRFRFIINFSFPGKEERRKIWEKVFPPDMPKDELDYERLARFSLSGGSISNIAISAAFMATGRDPARVSMKLIFEAIQSEYRKLERTINELDFSLKSK